MSHLAQHPSTMLKGLQQSAPRDAETSGVLIEKAATSPMTHDDTSPVHPGTDLYRFYDASDRLLYVGISLHAAMRASQHRAEKSWWPEVDRMTVDHLDADRAEAHSIERQTILIEKPLYNITHNAPPLSQPPAANGDGGVEFDASVVVDMYDADAVTTYNQLAAAMDALAKHCDKRARNGEEIGTRSDFLAVIEGLARSLVYGDCCDKCVEVRSPFILRFDGDRAQCGYLCPSCNNQWPCWWTRDLAILGAC